MDALQLYLQRQEEENGPSPSLQLPDNQQQTWQERVSFGVRSALGGLLVQQVASDSPVEPYVAPALSGNVRGADEGDTRVMKELRATLRTSKGYIDDVVAGNLEKKPFDRKLFADLLSRAEQVYTANDLTFPRQAYERLFKEKSEQAIGVLAATLFEYVTSNAEPVTAEHITQLARKITGWERFTGRSRLDQTEAVVAEMKGLYADEAHTFPVSQVSQTCGVTFVHGVPFYKNENGKHPQFVNNGHWIGKDHKNLRMEDFFGFLFSEQPDVSASAMFPSSSPKDFFSPYGVIIKEGRVYDAAHDDVASFGEGEPGYVRMRTKRFIGDKQPLSKRITHAFRNYQDHNEFIIGDQFEIGGVYFTEQHEGWAYLKNSGIAQKRRPRTKESALYDAGTVAKLSAIAEEHDVPLYKFVRGEGFVPVNYLSAVA